MPDANTATKALCTSKQIPGASRLRRARTAAVRVMEQISLFDNTTVQVDATHWNIYEGSKLLGVYELDRIGWQFKSCVGPMCGGGGPLREGESMERSLNHAVAVLKWHYEQTKNYVEAEE